MGSYGATIVNIIAKAVFVGLITQSVVYMVGELAAQKMKRSRR